MAASFQGYGTLLNPKVGRASRRPRSVILPRRRKRNVSTFERQPQEDQNKHNRKSIQHDQQFAAVIPFSPLFTAAGHQTSYGSWKGYAGVGLPLLGGEGRREGERLIPLNFTSPAASPCISRKAACGGVPG